MFLLTLERCRVPGGRDRHAIHVMLYHVVPGVAAYSTDLTDGQVIPTLEGSDLTVDLGQGPEASLCSC